MGDSIIEVSNLTRRFGARTALAAVSLSLPRGGVYGLVGANGAGKTTLIKHILGLLRAEGGSVRVFGLDPVADPVGVLSRIGSLSEDHDLPVWMRVGELMRYSRAFWARPCVPWPSSAPNLAELLKLAVGAVEGSSYTLGLVAGIHFGHGSA